MKKIKDLAACIHTLLYLKTCSFRHLNKNISKENFPNRNILYSNLCIKIMGSSSSFRRKRPVISLNCTAFIETHHVPKVHALVLALITPKNYAQKGCAMQLKDHLKSRVPLTSLSLH